MSWFMAAAYDRMMLRSEAACLAEWRQELLADVSGEVLEIGAGTGSNLQHYPRGLSRLVLSEPDRYMRSKLVHRCSEPGTRVEVLAAAADDLPLPSQSFDVVVSTLVLCSVRDLPRAVREVFRVLRPGGRLVFIEHVAADDPVRYRWQRRLEPVWKRIADGCHLTRRSHQAMQLAGFTLEEVRSESMRKAVPLVRPTVRGVARRER